MSALKTIQLGGATLRFREVRLDGVPVTLAELECEHSITKVNVIQGGRRWSHTEVVQGLCRRAMAETPCPCIERVLVQYEAGF
jgi:hypothetical protein